MPIKNETLIIEKLDHQGRGISYLNGKIVFIENALNGEKVEIIRTKETSKYIEAVATKIIAKSPKRVKSECPYYEKCGGCSLRSLSYNDTLEYKKNKVSEILKKYANIDINPIVLECSNQNNYRNKIEIKIKNGIPGFYKKGTHECISINKCLNAEKSINEFIKGINKLNLQNADITIKANYNDELIVSIKTNETMNFDINFFKNKYKLVGIIWNDKIVYGESYFIEIINNYYFRESYNSFFQVNRCINSKLFKIIEENIGKDDKVLELCCGVGTLSIVASEKAKAVYAIEINESAIKDALINAKMNKRDNVNFILGDAYKTVDKIDDKIDTIIIDPPRSGLTKEAIEAIGKTSAQKIIYISCNPMTLARDLKELKGEYLVKKAYILDMFPYTYHCESITVLEKR